METELKLSVTAEEPSRAEDLFARLEAVPALMGLPLGPAERVLICDTYYDTENLGLSAHGTGLRLRLANGVPLITLKIGKAQHGAVTQRQEYEEPLSQQSLDRILRLIIHQVGDGPVSVSEFAAGLRCGALIPVLQIRSERVTRSLGVCLDNGPWRNPMGRCPMFGA